MFKLEPYGLWSWLLLVVVDLAAFLLIGVGESQDGVRNFYLGAWFLTSLLQGAVATAFPAIDPILIGLGMLLASFKMAGIFILGKAVAESWNAQPEGIEP